MTDDAMIEQETDEPRTRRRWLPRRPWSVVLVVGAVLSAAVAGVALAGHDEPNSVVSTDYPNTTLPEYVDDPSTVTTDVPTTLPVAITIPRMTSPVRSRATPTTATTATTTPHASAALARPPCAGEKWGYGGFGCLVRSTQGRISVEFEEYGQILQVDRDHIQLRVTATDAQGGAEVSVRFDRGDGTTGDNSNPFDCSSSQPPAIGGGNAYVYPATGSYTVTVTVTTGLCDPDTRQMHDEQTATVSIPVLVCHRIDVVDGDVQCTTA